MNKSTLACFVVAFGLACTEFPGRVAGPLGGGLFASAPSIEAEPEQRQPAVRVVRDAGTPNACGQARTVVWEACQSVPRCDARRVDTSTVTALYDATQDALDALLPRACGSLPCRNARTGSDRNSFRCASPNQVCMTRTVELTCTGGGSRSQDEPTRTAPPSRVTPGATRTPEPPRRTAPAAERPRGGAESAPRRTAASPDSAARSATLPDQQEDLGSSGSRGRGRGAAAPASRSSAISAGTLTPYPFPARAEHLDAGEYWFWKFPDGHGTGSQQFAYDLTTARFDPDTKSWTECELDRNGKPKCSRCSAADRNEDCLVYNEPLYAMADGKVLRCWRNAPENPSPGESHWGRTSTPKRIGGGGNALVVQHDDGVVALYAHMRPGTIPPSLCPFNKELMDDADDKSEATIDEAKQPRVKRGQFIGRVGNTGASSNPHTHVHLQDGLDTTTGVPLNFGGALVRVATENPDGPWIRAKGQPRPGGDGLYWPDYSPGFDEIARHGLPADDYQLVFDHVAGSGYRLAWIDGFEHQNRIYFNVVFRPSDGKPWSASHNLTGDQYQDEVEKRKKEGFRLRHVESYSIGNAVRYAAIFVKDQGPGVAAYHGRTGAEHQKLFDEYTNDGWRPRNISVASVNGQRYYTALYDRDGSGSLLARSQLDGKAYQDTVEEQRAKGRELVYLNSYVHNGTPYFSAIFSSTASRVKARHGLTGAAYQTEWSDARKDGMVTDAVTAYSDGGAARYAAVWRRLK